MDHPDNPPIKKGTTGPVHCHDHRASMFAPNGMFSGVDHNFYEEDAPENMTPISIAKIEISLMENSACVYRKTKSSLTIGRSGGVSEMRLCGACV